MSLSSLLQLPVWLLALVGLAALALALMLAAPLTQPPPLASIQAGAMTIPQEGKPELSRFQARDGTWLAYRLYPAADRTTDRLAILAHGSSASSDEMNAVAQTLAAAGVAAALLGAVVAVVRLEGVVGVCRPGEVPSSLICSAALFP